MSSSQESQALRRTFRNSPFDATITRFVRGPLLNFNCRSIMLRFLTDDVENCLLL